MGGFRVVAGLYRVNQKTKSCSAQPQNKSMKLTVCVLSLPLLINVAYAQINKIPPKDLKKEIMRCAKSQTDVERLACFDELASVLGIEIPKERNVANPNHKNSKEDGKQSERKKLIAEAWMRLQIKRIEFMRDDLVQIIVNYDFDALDFEVKQNLCLAVLQYYKIDRFPNLSVVLLKDMAVSKCFFLISLLYIKPSKSLIQAKNFPNPSSFA